MLKTTPAQPTRKRTGHALVTGGAVLGFALLAVAANLLVPLVSALLWALLLGAVVANTVPRTAGLGAWADAAKFCLRLGIVGLGLQLSVSAVAATGIEGITVIVSTVAITYLSTRWMGRRLGMAEELVTLIAAGFAVCGAAAIAAVQDAVKARERDVATALALVTVFGTAMIIVIPVATTQLGLTDAQGAVWAGASIHEVAQVIAAASVIGGAVVPIASVIKLGRVMMLAPVYVHAARAHARPGQRRGPIVPWFVAGFVAMFLVRWTGLLDAEVIEASKSVTTLLLAAGMFGLGLGIRLGDLLSITPRTIALATFATIVATTVSGLQVLAFI